MCDMDLKRVRARVTTAAGIYLNPLGRIVFHRVLLHDHPSVVAVGDSAWPSIGTAFAGGDIHALATQIPHHVALNSDVQHIIIARTGREVHCSYARNGSDPLIAMPSLHGVAANQCFDMVVGAIIESADHLDASKPIVGHRIVLDVDIESVLVCPTKAPLDVNANSVRYSSCPYVLGFLLPQGEGTYEVGCHENQILMAHSALDSGIHHAGIGQDETHFLAIASEIQIRVDDGPILIRRGKGAGTVWVDRIGAGIGEVL